MGLVIPHTVLRQLKAMPRADAKRLLAAFELVAADPMFRHSFVTEMVGEPGVWRARKGNWRAVFEIVEGDVVVRKIGNRKDVYE